MIHSPLRPLLAFAFAILSTSLVFGQVDPADVAGAGGVSLEDIKIRVRVVKCEPALEQIAIAWRHGGEGLGGTVTRGIFHGENAQDVTPSQSWSEWLPLTQVAGKGGGWRFPTVTIAPPGVKKKKGAAPAITAMSVEFQFSRKGTPFKSFVEDSPKGATVGFAVPAGAHNRAEFEAGLQGLSGHARARRETLEKALGAPGEGPKLFGVIGHLGGYGEGAGYGIRHCNPQIVKEECLTLRLLGMNGVVDERSITLVDAGGMGQQFRHVFWGGSGVGSPTAFTKHDKNAAGCPFDPTFRASIAPAVQQRLAEYKSVHAEQNWGIAWDEIGVAAKEHINTCPRCAEEFRGYLKKLKIAPQALGKTSAEEVTPYPIWVPGGKKGFTLAPVPDNAADALRYYYTYRFMTYATAEIFPEAAQTLLKAGVRMYSMQGPTPSWGGHSLDWHEFYDLGANTALVWETSNRDPRVWQWESYLGDTMRGISQRHDLPIGTLVKPHRGTPTQRMLSAVTRGVKVFEWYTYGPDYSKGDSFSQSPKLLEAVAKADRFLASAEDVLYDAHWAGHPQVAFVTPRSSEIWGKVSKLGVENFEDAKWVYTALLHAHVPVDILSEQQLAEGKLAEYRVAYIVGPNLHRDAGQKLREWIEAGGVLWTDALGLSRDEANQLASIADLFPKDRTPETWGGADAYRATGLTALTGAAAPEQATISVASPGAPIVPAIGRVTMDAGGAEILAKFADGKPALVRRNVGKGRIVTAGIWAGLTYSAKVRRADFDMQADFSASVRDLIASTAIEQNVYRPVVPADPLVEAVLLDKKGQKSVALINWAYRANPRDKAEGLEPLENLTIRLPGVGSFKSVRSVVLGALTVQGNDQDRMVVLPRLNEVDVLVFE